MRSRLALSVGVVASGEYAYYRYFITSSDVASIRASIKLTLTPLGPFVSLCLSF